METKTKMNPEIKKKWVDALRSGEYVQGEGDLHALKDGKDTYCCLGVLCEIQNVPSTFEASQNRFFFEFKEAKCPAVPRSEFTTSLGITEDAVATLWKLNDGISSEEHNPKCEKLDFKQIADFIEENL